MGNRETKYRNRGASSHSTWDPAYSDGCCCHWEMTLATIVEQSLRETSRQHNQPPFMLLWRCFGALLFLYYLRVQLIHLLWFIVYIRYFLKSGLQHKGILQSVLKECRLAGLQWLEICEGNAGRTLRDKFKHVCYLYVWKHVALMESFSGLTTLKCQGRHATFSVTS